jgi:hypothetical protein
MNGGHTILAGLLWVIRLSWLVQLALGLAFWTGNLLALVPVHMLNVLLFPLLFEARAGLAAWAGVSWRPVLLSVAWGLLVPGLGVIQTEILPGDLHWLVQVAHLLVGLVAIGLAQRLTRRAQARLAERVAERSVALAAR